MRTRIRIPGLVAILALGLIAASPASAQERTVTVKGSATVEVPNDTAKLGFSVTKERRSRAEALRVVSVRLREVIGAVQTIPGVGAGDVTTGQISLRKIPRGERPPLYR